MRALALAAVLLTCGASWRASAAAGLAPDAGAAVPTTPAVPPASPAAPAVPTARPAVPTPSPAVLTAPEGAALSGALDGADPRSEEPGESSAELSELVDELSGSPDEAVAELVARIERAAAGPGPASSAAPDALFTAARACEERLLDPSRALALYEQVLAGFPDARVAVAAARRARHLRAQVGAAGASAPEAQALARLIAEAEALPLAEALRRADELAARAWPGAAEAALWSAELARRRGAAEEAQARYRAVMARFPGTATATLAIRGLAGAAIERGDWDLAEQMARTLPAADAADVVTRDELLAKAATGRVTDRWLGRAHAALAFAIALLLLSLAQVSGWRRPGAALRVLARPPLEVLYMAPVAALIVGASLTANAALAPAVAIICGGGLALAWLSGATLTEARRRGRDARWRSYGHVLVGGVAALALAYVAIHRGELLEQVITTLRVGPER
ncbi:MAG: hypothetical protein R3B48_29595 [Kofleriaceae bacterium]